MTILLFRTTIIYLLLIAAMRLMGKRQLGELQPSELVSTILISNLASIAIESPELPLAAGLIPLFLIVCLELFLSALSYAFPRLSEILSGHPVLIIRNGMICQKSLRELRISARDLLSALREQEVFDPSELRWAVVETNGKITICRDSSGSAPIPILVDGLILAQNLDLLKKDTDWLFSVLKSAGCQPKEVLLLLAESDGRLTIIKKESH